MKTVLVAGSKKIEIEADAKRCIAERLGAKIVSVPGWRLLTGGAKGNVRDHPQGGIDYHAALGAQRFINDAVKERECILTLHPREARSDLFEIGSVMKSRAKSTPARRYEMVARADCVILIEGHEGTSQIIEYSIAMGKPVIPISCTGGESKKAWDSSVFRMELLTLLALQEDGPELAILERGLQNQDELIATCLGIIQRLIRPTCFAVMPFSLPHSDVLWNIIRAMVEKVDMIPIRADLVNNVGPILEDITRCIAESSFVIVDITGANPNVMYELGYAQALKKPSVLVYCTSDGNNCDNNFPFDIRGMRVIKINPWLRQETASELECTIQKLSKNN